MKFCFKSFASGAIVATVGVATVFGAGSIQSAAFNANKVTLDGKALDLSSQPMVSVVKDGETAFSNYMPVRGVLEQMGYKVDWDSENSTVVVTSPGNAPVITGNSDTTAQPAPALNQADVVGAWEYTTDGGDVFVTILGSDNTAVFALETKDGDFLYCKGTYAIDGAFLKFNYTFVNDNGVISKEALTETAGITFDNGRMNMVIGNSTTAYTKLATTPDLSEFEAGEEAPAAAKEAVTMDMLEGAWIGSVEDSTEDEQEIFVFAKDGTLVHAVEDKDGIFLYDEGTFTIGDDNMLAVTFTYSNESGTETTEPITMSMLVEVKDSNSLYITVGNYVVEVEKTATAPDFSDFE